jgi:MSHA pilin protein MshC
MSGRGPAADDSGFTILEIVAVLLVLSVVSAVVVSRQRLPSLHVNTWADRVRCQLRYAQTRAMTSDSVWGLTFNGNSYALFRNGNAADLVQLPGEPAALVTLPVGLTVPLAVVAFDTWGAPYLDAAATTVQPPGPPRAIVLSSSLSAPSETQSITITPGTGFIP